MLLQGDSVERQAGSEAAKASAALVGLTRGWGQGQGYRRGSAMGSSVQHLGPESMCTNHQPQPPIPGTCQFTLLSLMRKQGENSPAEKGMGSLRA